METEETIIHCTPPAVSEAANTVMGQLLPKTSRQRYEDIYDKFMAWRQENDIHNFSENVFLAYFGELKAKYKSSTLWSIHSMLKSTLELKHGVKLYDYSKVKAFLKRASENYEAKKSKTLPPAEINKFLQEAPDEKFLLTKVVLAISLCGACRRDELWKIKLENIQDMGSALLIKLPDTKTKTVRTFTVPDEFYNLCKKYMNLRPKNCKELRFFLNYQNGRCTCQPVGINKIGKMPQQIASFLKLANPETYTGHCFRRSSATILVDAGADLLTLKRHGGWRSSSVAEGYVDDSVKSKLNISKKITESINVLKSQSVNMQSTSSEVVIESGDEVEKDATTRNKENLGFQFCNQVMDQTPQHLQPFSVSNCPHLTINITNNFSNQN